MNAIMEMLTRVEEYNCQVMASPKGATISNGSKTVSGMHKAMQTLKDAGHTVVYKTGIISVLVDGKEVL